LYETTDAVTPKDTKDTINTEEAKRLLLFQKMWDGIFNIDLDPIEDIYYPLPKDVKNYE